MVETGFDWTLAPLVLPLIFAGMLLATEVGRRLRVRHLRTAQGESTGFGPVQGAVFGLWDWCWRLRFLEQPVASTIAAT